MSDGHARVITVSTEQADVRRSDDRHDDRDGDTFDLGDLADDAQEAISDAADHPAVETAARFGYAANGVMHLLIGIVAIRLALGREGSADQGGALGMLTEHTWGTVLLILGVIGWGALAFWQVGEACLSFLATSSRLKAVAKGITYAVLCGMCAVTLVTGKSTDTEKQNSTLTGRVMVHGWGVVLVALVGLVIMGVGAYHVVKGVKKKFFEDLQDDPGDAAEVAGVVGYTLKGVALVLTGVVVVNGAMRHDAHDTGGLDTTLHHLLRQPFGDVLVGAIGVGFIAYALYSAARARHAKV